MLDIKFIRENKDLVIDAARKKKIRVDIEGLIRLDEKRRALLLSLEPKRRDQAEFGRRIALVRDTTERQQLIEEMRLVKEDIQKEEEELKNVMQEWRKLMLLVPNIPDITVPEGEKDEDSVEVKKWGTLPTFPFTPKSHTDLMTNLNLVDFERGVKVSGFRGYFLKGDSVRLSFALWRYTLDRLIAAGFTPLMVPSLVTRESAMGTGYLPQGEEDLYRTQDDTFLAGTGEVASMAYHMDDTFSLEALPKKYVAFSPCFRREAGSYGRDTKGLMRVHEFFKLEQVIFCQASHEESVRFHDELNRTMEMIIEDLEIPYRTIVNHAGDLGLGQVKKYDIELWVPSEKTYREISSASYFHDFQTRRLNVRYRDTSGKLSFAHSLNCTAMPTPRILIALLENHQQEDGSIKLPQALIPYFGESVIQKNA